ncbi:uncharacterized protein LOC144526042 isoform X5 [Sander vitreus]
MLWIMSSSFPSPYSSLPIALIMDWLRPVLDWIWPVVERLMALYTGSRTRTVADSNSVVTDRTIKDTNVNHLNMAVETVSGAGSGPSGNAAGESAQADCYARDGSVISIDKISNLNVKGDLDLSVTVKPSKAE